MKHHISSNNLDRNNFPRQTEKDQLPEYFDNHQLPNLRLLMLITQIEPAGAQKAMLTLAAGLKRHNGFKVTICTMYDKNNFIPEMESRFDVPIINLRMKDPSAKGIVKQFYLFATGIITLSKIIRNNNIQIIQTFTHFSDAIGPIVAWLNGVSIRVTSIRTSTKFIGYLPNFLNRYIQPSFLVTKIVSVSESVRIETSKQLKIPLDKILTIHNSINLSKYFQLSNRNTSEILAKLGLTNNSQIILTVGRLHPQKGQVHLIRAIPGILLHHPTAMILFAGEGPLRENLEQLASELGVTNNTLFLGNRSDIIDILKVSSLFVLPSLYEGMPNAVLEAMAAGVPVIATQVDGIPEIIPDERYGFLVPPADTDALGVSICRLLNDKNLCATIVQNAKNRVLNEFTEDIMISKYVELYNDLYNARNHQ